MIKSAPIDSYVDSSIAGVFQPTHDICLHVNSTFTFSTMVGNRIANISVVVKEIVFKNTSLSMPHIFNANNNYNKDKTTTDGLPIVLDTTTRDVPVMTTSPKLNHEEVTYAEDFHKPWSIPRMSRSGNSENGDFNIDDFTMRVKEDLLNMENKIGSKFEIVNNIPTRTFTYSSFIVKCEYIQSWDMHFMNKRYEIVCANYALPDADGGLYMRELIIPSSSFDVVAGTGSMFS